MRLCIGALPALCIPIYICATAFLDLFTRMRRHCTTERLQTRPMANVKILRFAIATSISESELIMRDAYARVPAAA